MTTITRQELAEFLATEFPQTKCTVDAVGATLVAIIP